MNPLALYEHAPARPLPAIRAPFEGGYFAGRIHIDGKPHALIVAPRALGEIADVRWHSNYKSVDAARSLYDGRANTIAMAAAGSELARWALDLNIGGFTDWYIGAQDELEIAYRAFKPGAAQNALWNRSGINVSAVSPTYPYTLDFPQQTDEESFRTGGAEAFEEEAYWGSTQHASYASYAYGQDFSHGYQGFWDRDDKLRARAFRRLPI